MLQPASEMDQENIKMNNNKEIQLVMQLIPFQICKVASKKEAQHII